MSTVLLVTGDDILRDQVGECAARAGVYLTVHTGLSDALPDWGESAMVLLGADLVHTALGIDLPAHGQLLVVATAAGDLTPLQSVEQAGAAYFVVLPTGTAWLTEQLQRMGDDVVNRLRRIGFRLGYADRAAARDAGSLWCSGLHDWRSHEEQAPFVSLENVARGNCQAGQSDTRHRSNYRSLHRVYPQMWTDLVYSNVTGLGAFVCDLPPEVVDVVCALKTSDPLFDDEDHGALEAEEIAESWEQWVSADVQGLLGARARAVWDVLTAQALEQLWWDVVHGVGYQPEHDGYSVRWDYDQVVPAFAARLMAEYRRGWRHDNRYQILRTFAGQPVGGPKYGLFFDTSMQLLAMAYTRFEARVQAWQHQAARRATFDLIRLR